MFDVMKFVTTINMRAKSEMRTQTITRTNINDEIRCLHYFSDVDDCVNHACTNGGSCVDGVNSYSCSCVNGYSGDRCEKGDRITLSLPHLILSSSHNTDEDGFMPLQM